jgi:hypothetical protein
VSAMILEAKRTVGGFFKSIASSGIDPKFDTVVKTETHCTFRLSVDVGLLTDTCLCIAGQPLRIRGRRDSKSVQDSAPAVTTGLSLLSLVVLRLGHFCRGRFGKCPQPANVNDQIPTNYRQ